MLKEVQELLLESDQVCGKRMKHNLMLNVNGWLQMALSTWVQAPALMALHCLSACRSWGCTAQTWGFPLSEGEQIVCSWLTLTPPQTFCPICVSIQSESVIKPSMFGNLTSRWTDVECRIMVFGFSHVSNITVFSCVAPKLYHFTFILVLFPGVHINEVHVYKSIMWYFVM